MCPYSPHINMHTQSRVLMPSHSHKSHTHSHRTLRPHPPSPCTLTHAQAVTPYSGWLLLTVKKTNNTPFGKKGAAWARKRGKQERPRTGRLWVQQRKRWREAAEAGEVPGWRSAQGGKGCCAPQPRTEVHVGGGRQGRQTGRQLVAGDSCLRD